MSNQDTIDLSVERSRHSLQALGINVDAIYDEMGSLGIKIDLSITPDVLYINNKMVSVREASLAAQRIYLRIQRALGDSQSWLLNLETSFDILSSSKMEFDAEVRAGQSIDDRKAIVNNKLVDYKRAIKEAKNNVSLLKALNKAIDLCIKNIDRSDADVKQQARLMESQMRNLKATDISAAMRDSNLRRTEEDMASMDKLFQDSMESSTTIHSVGSEDSADLGLAEEPDCAVLAEDVTGLDSGDDVGHAGDGYQDSAALEETLAGGDTEMLSSDDVTASSLVACDDFGDDCVSIAPGLTGAPQGSPYGSTDVALASEDDLLSVLDSIPSTGKSGLSSTTPASTEPADALLDFDDCTGLDIDDLAGDLAEADQVVPVAEDDMFGGLVESSVVTEQKVPKIIREQQAKSKPVPEQKASVENPAQVKHGAAKPPKKQEAPKQAAAEEPAMSLDDLINDLGI